MNKGKSRHHDLIFWDVDTQADFVLPGGRLYAPGAEQIVPNLERLTQFARDNHILILSSADAHQPDDPEFSQWPPHCVVDTPGHDKLPPTLLPQRLVVPPTPVALPQDFDRFQQVVLQKQTTDVFSNPNLERLLAILGKPDVVLYGVVTEVCVHIAGHGLLDRGHRVWVVTDAIAPINREEGERTLAQLRIRGAEMMETKEVMNRVRKVRRLEDGARVAGR